MVINGDKWWEGKGEGAGVKLRAEHTTLVSKLKIPYIAPEAGLTEVHPSHPTQI